MQFQFDRAFAACALAFGILASSNSGAAQPEAVAISDGGVFKPVWAPLGVSKAAVTVVVQLSGDPVALHQERAGRKLAGADKERIKGALRNQQDALRGSIEAMGGRVLAQFQSSYNGIKVRIGRDRAAALASLPGVVAVRPLQVFKPDTTAAIFPDNIRGLPLIGAPAVWQNLALRGEGVKIAILDTGIDYTHAAFGGPGTTAAFDAAKATSTLPANPALFGRAAARIKGGIDLVGDDYNASADPDEDGNPSPALIPHPDPNPLDCNGHGTHVAGTAGGSGVTAAGATYNGPYDATTLASNSWLIAPGVAPKSDLYAVRVFGCAGSTDVVIEAIEWAVDNDMDVINMSLGSPFGSKDDPSAVASTNAARAGVIVVASAGNSGASQYITGSPATAEGAISVAANDPWVTTPGVRVQTTPPTGTALTLSAVNANGHEFTAPFSGPLVVLQDNPATTSDEEGFIGSANESLGCSPAAYTYNGVVSGSGQVAVAQRGACARVARAIFGQQAGAAAVIMTNNAAGLPPFEGAITGNPDTGIPFTVTIPFAGVAGNQATPNTDSFRLRASPAGTTVSLSEIDLANANYTGFASFTSGGPRTGDSGLKPDITAPGVSIASAGIGKGTGASIISGTSMAAPHVAGVAALTRQAHPDWTVDTIKAAIVNTGLPAGVLAYRTSRGGTGLVQPVGSTTTQVVATANGEKFNGVLSYGVAELKSDFSRTKDLLLRNRGASAVTYSVAQARAAGVPHGVSFSAGSITVPANGTASVAVTLSVPASTAGSAGAFREAAGLVELTPQGGGAVLRVPYHVVTRPQANVSTRLGRLAGSPPSTTATVTNPNGTVAGAADFYAWGLADNNTGEKSSADIRAVGVQSFAFPNAADPTRRLIVFAVNTYHRWSNAASNEFDIEVDVDGNGSIDYVVVGVDQGAVQTGSFNGVMGSFVFSTRSPGASIAFLASAPTDSSTALLPVLSTQLCRLNGPGPEDDEPCLSQATNPRITYRAVGFDLLNGGAKAVAGSARFNVWSSSISQGGFASVAPNGTPASVPISVNPAEWAKTPAMGIMVVTHDNKSGAEEAQLISVDPR